MPPKADPYATKSARAVDLLLILFALLAVVLLILTAPRHRPNAGGTTIRPVSGKTFAANDSPFRP